MYLCICYNLCRYPVETSPSAHCSISHPGEGCLLRLHRLKLGSSAKHSDPAATRRSHSPCNAWVVGKANPVLCRRAQAAQLSSHGGVVGGAAVKHRYFLEQPIVIERREHGIARPSWLQHCPLINCDWSRLCLIEVAVSFLWFCCIVCCIVCGWFATGFNVPFLLWVYCKTLNFHSV